MSLDVYLSEVQPTIVHEGNITHNLGKMSDVAGLYTFLWTPEECGIKIAGDLIVPLACGLERLKADPEKYRAYNPENGWGKYESLVRFVENYLAACRKFPSAKVEACR